jgi:hypothetical protein
MRKVHSIERKDSPKGAPEVPFLTSHGDYQMADPAFGRDERHKVEHAIYVKGPGLEKVAVNLDRGLLLWMKQPKKRKTLICPASLRIKWA